MHKQAGRQLSALLTFKVFRVVWIYLGSQQVCQPYLSLDFKRNIKHDDAVFIIICFWGAKNKKLRWSSQETKNKVTSALCLEKPNKPKALGGWEDDEDDKPNK